MSDIINSPVITRNTKISDIIASVIQIISSLKKISDKKIMLDLSQVEYASPFFVLPMVTYILQTRLDVEIKLSESLQKILFPSGLQIEGLRPLQLNSKLNEFVNKDFLPLFIFPSNALKDDSTSSVMTIIEKVLYSQLGLEKNIESGLKYILGEINGNITEHSKSSKALFYSTINKEKNVTEIGIADFGVGLLGSYNNNNDKDIFSDLDAVQAANRGISTKNLPSAENRGFGIVTSRRMINDGLNGTFSMISGHAMFTKSPDLKNVLEFSPRTIFKGTIVIFNIPLCENKKFNYLNYLEYSC